MASFKVVISDPKSRRAYQKEVDQDVSGLVGKKIGDPFPGDSLGLGGYSLEITGGSDKEGFPMRRDVEGQARKRLLLTATPGFHPGRGGQKKRKSVRGNAVSQDIVQINAKVVKHGNKAIEELLGIKPKEPKKKAKEGKEKTAEKPKEEKAVQAEKHEEKPKEEHKPKEKEAKPAEPAGEAQEKAEKKMGVKKLE